MKSILISLLLVSLSLWGDSSYDRTITTLDKSRDEAVKEVVRKMLFAYQDEDARTFFDHVSEDRFIQDYITFSDGVYNDFRLYDILEIDYWFEEVISDHIVRIVQLRWQERYESLESSQQYEDKGLSRFFFDEVDGAYLLIKVEGNNLFAKSSPEWHEEVPPIAGQEQASADGPAADILPNKYRCEYTSPDNTVVFEIANIGSVTASGDVTYTATNNPSGAVPAPPSPETDTFAVSIPANSTTQSINTNLVCDCNDQITITLSSTFRDEDTSNNTITFNADPGGCP